MKKILIIMIVFLGCIIVNFNMVNAVSDINLNAKNAILYDRKCKRVLYEKNAKEKVPNASTTKILTAIVVVESCDVNEMAEISQNAVNVTGSKVKFRKGDKITVNDLINGMLLCSGNDAAIALAEHVAGNVSNFCQMMNVKAKKIGAMNTNFLTPHGLDEEGHYSTAYDLAIIADYALNIPYLANIFMKKTEIIHINKIPRNISTTNEMLHVYPKANGIKTGFTNDAGRCLVTSATDEEGWQIISVVLGCDTKKFRTQDSKKLLDYGFENYDIVDIGSVLPNKIIFEVEKSLEKAYKIDMKYEFLYPVTEDEKGKIRYKEKIVGNLVAPVPKNVKIAEYQLLLGENIITEVEVKLDEIIERKDEKIYFWELLNKISKSIKM